MQADTGPAYISFYITHTRKFNISRFTSLTPENCHFCMGGHCDSCDTATILCHSSLHASTSSASSLFLLFYATRLLFRERAHVLFLQSLSKQGHVERERRGRLRSIPPLSRSPQLEKAVGDRPQSGRQYRGLPTLAAASGVLTAT